MSFVSDYQTHFTPHCLRIGGHTFYSIQNMNEDFVNYLGRRKIARASQLYYRANAIDNISRLRIFFEKISESSVLDVGVFN